MSEGTERADAHDPRLAWAIAPGALLAGVAGGLAFPILPTVGQRVGLSLAFIGVILAANRAARIFANPVVGLLVDRFGGRRTFLYGLAIQLVTMILYWIGVKTSHAGSLFLIGRILHGPGGSCVFVAGQALALHAGGAQGRGQASGVVRSAMAVGTPLGLVLGGLLADAWGEAHVFEAAGGSIVLAWVGAYFLLPDLRVAFRRPPTIGDALRALSDKRIGAIGALNFAASFVGSGLVLTTAVLLVHARHIQLFGLPERATASAFMGWLIVTEALSMPVFGRIGDRRSAHAWVAALGIVSMIPSLLIIAKGEGIVSYAIGVGALGVGVGALGPSVLALLAQLVPPTMRGVAVGAIQVAADLGGALGPLLGTAFFASSVQGPYLFGAVVLAFFVPPALWLTRARPAALPLE